MQSFILRQMLCSVVVSMIYELPHETVRDTIIFFKKHWSFHKFSQLSY